MKNFLKTFVMAGYCMAVGYIVGRLGQASRDIDAGLERIYIIGKPGDNITVSFSKNKDKKPVIVPFEATAENEHTDAEE